MHQPEKQQNTLRKWLKRLLIILAVYCVSSVLLSAVMFRVLFPRKDGISPVRWNYEEIDRTAYPRERFQFRSGSNLLTGYRYPAAEAKGLIVVVNGIGAGADSHLAEIMYFTDHGWSVATWDATGVGESEGRGLIGLQQIRLDLLAFLEELPDLGGGLPVVLYAHSAGAYAAATTLTGDTPVRGAVCLCGFDSPVSLMLYHARKRVGPLADLQYPFLLLENRFLFGKDADVSAVEALRNSSVPVLLIECNSDDYVPHEQGLLQDLTALTGTDIRMITVDTGWRNEHNTPWLSASAAEYVGSLEKNAPADKARANELDPDFMALILDFFDAAVQ